MESSRSLAPRFVVKPDYAILVHFAIDQFEVERLLATEKRFATTEERGMQRDVKQIYESSLC